MSFPARQSTARTYMIGPVLDANGVAVTSSVVGNFKISKNGAAPAALDGSATLTHRHTGHYSLALTASDHDTVGTAQVTIDDTTNACAPLNLQVVEEAVFDALLAASATGALPVSTGGIVAASFAAGAMSSLFTTQMTEAYAADGVAPTLAQAMFRVMQNLCEFSITGTTLTAKKLDKSTTAESYALDDASNPTSRTRAS